MFLIKTKLFSSGHKLTTYKISFKLYILELNKNGQYSSNSQVVPWRVIKIQMSKNLSVYSHPSGPKGYWFQQPPSLPKSADAQAP